jgi:catechol 2,3-dioxygenase-like lactoylglutathione lyase family enzyme
MSVMGAAMSDGFRIDHVVILVDELASAIEDYSKLGFTVTPGGEHPAWGSHNALIGLADGSYIELIAFRRRASDLGQRTSKEALADRLRMQGRSAVECRVEAWQAPMEGIVDFALLPPDIGRDIVRAQQHGLPVDGPLPGGRTRPDGQEVRWQLGIPRTYDVPFLCGDVTPRSLRVPPPEACRHANGVIGIDHLTVVAVDLDATIMRYRALGIVPKYFDYSWPETRTAEFWIGSVPLTVLSPAGPLSPAWEALAPRGQGPFRLDLRNTRHQEIEHMGANLLHGAQIGLIFRD